MDNLHIKLEGDQKHLIVQELETRRVHPWNVINYGFGSTKAFIAYIKNRVDKNVSTVFYNDKGIRVNIDEFQQDKPVSTGSYEFQLSKHVETWIGLTRNQSLSQNGFVKFLKGQDPEVVKDLELLIGKLGKLTFVTVIDSEHTAKDMKGNSTIMYKSKDGEGSVAIPDYIYINVDMLKDGVLGKVDLPFELILNKPKNEEDRPTITLTCDRFNLFYQKAVEAEQDFLVKELSEYLVVASN